MSKRTVDHGFFGREYIAALKEHYPELVDGAAQSIVDRVLHVGIIDRWMQSIDIVGVDAPDRFQRISDRPWASERSVWVVPRADNNVRYASVRYSYKGLINLKPAIDHRCLWCQRHHLTEWLARKTLAPCGNQIDNMLSMPCGCRW